MKTSLALLALTVVATGLGVWYWLAGTNDTPQFRTLPAKRGDLLIAVTATGTVEPREVVDVGVQIMGRIKSLGPDPDHAGETVDYGSRVEKDMLLAELDDQQIQVELQKAKASLTLAEAELERHKARLTKAERDFERAKLLRETNAEADYDTAVAQYEMAKAELAVGMAQVEQAKIAKHEVEVNLKYTQILSPIDGVVIDRRVNVGQTVVASMSAPTLFLLAKDLEHMQVWAAVNEADIGDVELGQRVTFKVDAYRDMTFEGCVSQIRLNASMLNNVVAYGVVVDIDNTEGKLLPYMTANLQFEVARRKDVLLVPNQALRWQPTWEQVTPAARAELSRAMDGEPAGTEKVELDTPRVWLKAEDGLVRPVPVEVGLSDGMTTEIAAGELPPGTEIVVSAVRKAQPDFVSSFINKVTKKDDEE